MTESDLRRFGEREKRYSMIALAVGVMGLAVAVVWAFTLGSDGRGASRFAHAYLTAFMYVLSLSVGAIAFLLLTYLFRGGWHILFRRIPETLAAAVGVTAIMGLPIIGFVIADNGMLYNWAQPIEKIHYLTPMGENSPEIYGGEPIFPPRPESGGHHGAPEAAPDNPSTKPAKPDGHHDHDHGPQAVIDVNHFQIIPVHAGHGGEAGHAHVHMMDDSAAVAGEDAHLDHDSNTSEGKSHVKGYASGGHEKHLDKMMVGKRPWLNIPFFSVRVVLYLLILTGIGVFFLRNSLEQDESADPLLTRRAEKFAAPGTLVFGLTLTFLVFDLVMSLDWTWYSTMLGVYYFAGCMIGALSLMILLSMRLNGLGYLGSMSKEHYHDLGKLLFGFVFFWGYIAYSQYVLLWYASLPATTVWYAIRGVTTVPEQITPISYISLFLLFGQLVLPFLGLLSRHVKRRQAALAFWAVWLLLVHYIDVWWLVMPQFEHQWIALGPVEIGCLIGLLGIFAFAVIQIMSRHSLVPLHDPRMHESLRFHNI